MKLSEKIIINSPILNVWSFFINPQNWPLYNNHIIDITSSESEVHLSSSLWIKVKLSKSTEDAQCVITEYEPLSKLTIQFNMSDIKGSYAVTETLLFKEKRSGVTQLQRILDMSQTPIPKWARPIIWFIMTFGKPVDKSTLQITKKLIEQSST